MDGSSSGWKEVGKKPEVAKGKDISPQASGNGTISNTKLAEEEELISAAQCILRKRLDAIDSKAPGTSTANSRKHQRRKIRQEMYALSSCSENDDRSTSSASVSKRKASNFGSAFGGQRRSRPAHSKEA